MFIHHQVIFVIFHALGPTLGGGFLGRSAMLGWLTLVTVWELIWGVMCWIVGLTCDCPSGLIQWSCHYQIHWRPPDSWNDKKQHVMEPCRRDFSLEGIFRYKRVQHWMTQEYYGKVSVDKILVKNVYLQGRGGGSCKTISNIQMDKVENWKKKEKKKKKGQKAIQAHQSIINPQLLKRPALGVFWGRYLSIKEYIGKHVHLKVFFFTKLTLDKKKENNRPHWQYLRGQRPLYPAACWVFS